MLEIHGENFETSLFQEGLVQHNMFTRHQRSLETPHRVSRNLVQRTDLESGRV